MRTFSTLEQLTPHKPPMHVGVLVVPQQRAFVIERFGKFHAILEPGLHFQIPLVDQVAYVHSLKEEALAIERQMAITQDNVTLTLDGVLYVKISDPYKASYGVSNAMYAVTQLAQTSMRSELGKISLDKTFEERESLNRNIVESISAAARNWGIECLRYEIRDIVPPSSIQAAMELQAEAERRKRASILNSEGERQAAINVAQGQQQATVLHAQAEAESVRVKAQASADAVGTMASAIGRPKGADAVAMALAEQYLAGFEKLAQDATTVLLPANVAEPASVVASAMGVFHKLQNPKTSTRPIPETFTLDKTPSTT